MSKIEKRGQSLFGWQWSGAWHRSGQRVELLRYDALGGLSLALRDAFQLLLQGRLGVPGQFSSPSGDLSGGFEITFGSLEFGFRELKPCFGGTEFLFGSSEDFVSPQSLRRQSLQFSAPLGCSIAWGAHRVWQRDWVRVAQLPNNCTRGPTGSLR